ncbi:hypothetical protein D3C79_823220 [compost metagenome]
MGIERRHQGAGQQLTTFGQFTHHKGHVAAGELQGEAFATAAHRPELIRPRQYHHAQHPGGQHAAEPLLFKQHALGLDGHGGVIEGQRLHLFAGDPLVLSYQHGRGIGSETDELLHAFLHGISLAQMGLRHRPSRACSAFSCSESGMAGAPTLASRVKIRSVASPMAAATTGVRPMRGSRDSGSTPIRVSRLGDSPVICSAESTSASPS